MKKQTTNDWILGSRLLNEQLDQKEAISPLVLQVIITSKSRRKQLETFLRQGQDITPIITAIQADLRTREIEKTPSELATNAAQTLWDWLKDGFGLVDPNRYQKRLSACRVCPYFDPAPRQKVYRIIAGRKQPDPICKKCGCTLAKKLKLTVAKCPEAHPDNQDMSLWGEPVA